MLCGKGRVKRLDPQRSDIFLETFRAHQRNRSQSADIAVVQVAPVVERQMEGRIRRLRSGKRAQADEERAGKSGLHNDAVPGAQIEHYELGSAPASRDTGAS